MRFKDEVEAELRACSRLAKLTPSARRLQEKKYEAKVRKEEADKKAELDKTYDAALKFLLYLLPFSIVAWIFIIMR